MSVVMFVHNDYITCLKIIKLINCITHVMTILGPCGNNAFFLSNKFQMGMARFCFFLCVHMLTDCSRRMQIDTVPSSME